MAAKKYPRLSSALVRRAVTRTFGDFGSQLLYKLCREHPGHVADDVVAAKLLFIGRDNAAAIERSKNKKEDKGDFYRYSVAPIVRRSSIDNWMNASRESRPEDLGTILEMHRRLMELFNKISG